MHLTGLMGGGAPLLDTAFPPLTANSMDGYVASASAEIVGGEAWRAFNKDHGVMFWHSGGAANNSGWLQVKFPSARRVRNYIVQARSSTPLGTPRAWTLKGSNNGANWTDLDTRTGFTSWSGSEPRAFDVTSPGRYTYYRLDMVGPASNTEALSLGELGLFSDPNDDMPYLAGCLVMHPSGTSHRVPVQNLQEGDHVFVLHTWNNVDPPNAEVRLLNSTGPLFTRMQTTSFNDGSWNPVAFVKKIAASELSHSQIFNVNLQSSSTGILLVYRRASGYSLRDHRRNGVYSGAAMSHIDIPFSKGASAKALLMLIANMANGAPVVWSADKWTRRAHVHDTNYFNATALDLIHNIKDSVSPTRFNISPSDETIVSWLFELTQ